MTDISIIVYRTILLMDGMAVLHCIHRIFLQNNGSCIFGMHEMQAASGKSRSFAAKFEMFFQHYRLPLLVYFL